MQFNTSAGVIWRGDSVIEGVPETLNQLRSMVSTGQDLSALLVNGQFCINLVAAKQARQLLCSR